MHILIDLICTRHCRSHTVHCNFLYFQALLSANPARGSSNWFCKFQQRLSMMYSTRWPLGSTQLPFWIGFGYAQSAFTRRAEWNYFIIFASKYSLVGLNMGDSWSCSYRLLIFIRLLRKTNWLLSVCLTVQGIALPAPPTAFGGGEGYK